MVRTAQKPKATYDALAEPQEFSEEEEEEELVLDNVDPDEEGNGLGPGVDEPDEPQEPEEPAGDEDAAMEDVVAEGEELELGFGEEERDGPHSPEPEPERQSLVGRITTTFANFMGFGSPPPDDMT